jgi:hypothetical protein
VPNCSIFIREARIWGGDIDLAKDGGSLCHVSRLLDRKLFLTFEQVKYPIPHKWVVEDNCYRLWMEHSHSWTEVERNPVYLGQHLHLHLDGEDRRGALAALLEGSLRAHREAPRSEGIAPFRALLAVAGEPICPPVSGAMLPGVVNMGWVEYACEGKRVSETISMKSSRHARARNLVFILNLTLERFLPAGFLSFKLQSCDS